MIRQLIVIGSEDFPDVLPRDGTRDKSPEEIERFLVAAEDGLRKVLGGYKGSLKVLGVPSLDFEVRLTQAAGKDIHIPPVESLVFSVAIPDLHDDGPDIESLNEFRKVVDDTNQRAIDQGMRKPVLGVGADLTLSEAEYFGPATVDQLLFGNRNSAAKLTEASILKQEGLTGQGVNIVVIDRGFDLTKVKHFGGGLAIRGVEPGITTRGHGLMLIRNITDAAPDAIFYDAPLIPTRITDVNVAGFLSTALAAFSRLKQVIVFLRSLSIPPWDGPWVLVNAWSIFDRSFEIHPGDYSANPSHPLNVAMGEAVDAAIDVVFAAGNCGQFCPDRRCGKLDVGPGNSIFGANSHPRVLTLGAVRTDARWMGGSSQGPGLLSHEKPDLCAPSYFREVGDAFVGNLNDPFVGNTGSPYIASTGTSAACGLAAGIVGAIRSGWDQRRLSPDDLRRALNDHARKTEGPGWKEHLGNGIIDAKETVSALRARYP